MSRPPRRRFFAREIAPKWGDIGGQWRASNLARAVVPPPRLRAKWVIFSAPLRTALGGSGRTHAWRFGGGRNLRNPARVDVSRNAISTYGRLNSVGASGKRLGFFLGGSCVFEGPCLLGLRPNFNRLGWVRLKVSYP